MVLTQEGVVLTQEGVMVLTQEGVVEQGRVINVKQGKC